MSCRLVGDKLPVLEDVNITSLPMSIQPLTNAKNAELQLQVMLAKARHKNGMLGNYFEKKVILKVK